MAQSVAGEFIDLLADELPRCLVPAHDEQALVHQLRYEARIGHGGAWRRVQDDEVVFRSKLGQQLVHLRKAEQVRGVRPSWPPVM